MTTVTEILGYQVIQILGQGARSTIYAVKDSENNLFALKRVVKNDAGDQRFLDQAVLEHEIARRFCHPNLRRSFKLYRQRRLLRISEVVVLMELVDGLTLEQHRPKSMREICRICQQVSLALHEMHEGGYVHCDIKPNNIMLTGKRMVKIIDFGQSCPIGTIKERIQGTPDYIAPEQVRREAITHETDVFNLGATMYWMLTGKHVPTLIPKRGMELTAQVHAKPDPVTPPRELRPEIPPALSSLVMDCVQFRQDDRPSSMTQVYDRLQLAIAQVPESKSSDSDEKHNNHSSHRSHRRRRNAG